VPWSASGNLTGWTLLRASALMYRRCSAHSSVCSMLQRADEEDDGSSIRGDPYHIGAPADLLVQALLEGLVLQIWRQSSLAEVRQGKQILAGRFEVSSSLGQLGCERLGAPLELKL